MTGAGILLSLQKHIQSQVIHGLLVLNLKFVLDQSM